LSIIWGVIELVLKNALENFLLGLGSAITLLIYFQIF
jgi:hypothetical protein